jgi:hypothetical protein
MPIHFSSAAVAFARRGPRITLPCVALIISLGIAHAAPPETTPVSSRTSAPASDPASNPAMPRLRADMKGATASHDVRLVTDWIMRNNKHRGHPFIVADKVDGFLFAFDANGVLLARAPALFGAMKGDVLTEEQANKTLAETLGADMITPAGVFPAHAYRSHSYGESVRFAKYANTNLLIHRAPGEKRRKLLESSSLRDSHITLGCINVLPEFISKVLVPHFRGESTVVVLPETQSAHMFFAINDATEMVAQAQITAAD